MLYPEYAAEKPWLSHTSQPSVCSPAFLRYHNPMYMSPSGISTKGQMAAEPREYRRRTATYAATPRQEHGSAAPPAQYLMSAVSLQLNTVSLPTKYLGLDGPGGAPCLPRLILMYLHCPPHRREQPPIILTAPHPAPL